MLKGLFLLINFISLKSAIANDFEKNLKSQLLSNYRIDSLPLVNSSKVDMHLGIVLRSFNEINQMDGTLTTNIWLRHWWYDEYLMWDPLKWNNISSIVLFTDSDISDTIWIPDIYLYNTAENPLSELNLIYQFYTQYF